MAACICMHRRIFWNLRSIFKISPRSKQQISPNFSSPDFGKCLNFTLDVSTSSTQPAYKYFFLVDVSETKKIAVVFFPGVWILHPACLGRKV